MKALVNILLLILFSIECHAITRYVLPSNGFKSLLAQQVAVDGVDVATIDNKLDINNTTASNYVLVDSTILPTNYRYSVLLANSNNTYDNSVNVIDSDSSISTIEATCWGIAFDIQQNGDMLTIELQGNNGYKYDDLNYNRSMTISLFKHSSGESTLIESVAVNSNVDLNDGDNVLTVDVNNNNIRVLIGRKKPRVVMEKEGERKDGNYQVGIWAGAGSHVKLKRGLLAFEPDKRMIVPTLWTKESLEEYLAQSVDPMEGMWQYLDRDVEEKIARMGGRYTIATVKADNNSYYIIYCSGAQVNNGSWKPFLLKGKLSQTIFSNNYDAMWIDSTFNVIENDVQATIENGVILSIKFPVLKSQLRFSKILSAQG